MTIYRPACSTATAPPPPLWAVNPLTYAQKSHNSQNHPGELRSEEFSEFGDLREGAEE